MTESRYLRHSMIDWFDQGMLRDSKVVVVGAGAVGNEVLKNLCLLGVGRIHIIDFDRIEIHNLTRSVLFKESDVGFYKAEVAARACQSIDSTVDVSFRIGDFWKTLSIEALQHFDAAICCVDNFEARIRLNQMCRLANTDLFNAGIDSRYVCVERYPFKHQRGCACYECGLPLSVYGRIKERYSCGWLKKRAYEEKKVPTTTVTASMAGAMLASLYLHGNRQGSPHTAARYYLDSIDMSLSVSSMQPNEACPNCSSAPAHLYYVKVKNTDVQDVVPDYESSGDTQVYLSDKVITRITCGICGTTQTVNHLADSHDDSLLFCPACGQYSNDAAITDIMTLSELREVFKRSPLPCKYIHFRIDNTQFVIEMEVQDAGLGADHQDC